MHDHLVHGMGTELEAPAWPAITLAEAEAILARFPQAGQVLDLQWHSPRPFSAAALLRTEHGTFFLKRHHRSLRSPAALAEEHRFMAHLRAKGLSVPEVLATAGRGAVAEGQWTYELLRKAPGRDLYRDRQSWTPFIEQGHAFAAGAALARLHQAARDFAERPRANHPLVASFTILPARDPLAAADGYIAARPALADYLADKPWRQQLDRLLTALGGADLSVKLAGQPGMWTHNDWHPSNLLWSDDGTVDSVIDFGLATRTCALHDLATAIERSAIPWLDVPDRTGDADAACAILAGYRSVLPISAAEVETVLALLPLVHIEFALSEVDYFVGVLDDRDQAKLAWQDYLIDHADWFLSRHGRDFLGALKSGARGARAGHGRADDAGVSA